MNTIEQELLTPEERDAIDARMRPIKMTVVDVVFNDGELRPHELALLFPKMDQAAFDELVDDIREHGVHHPVVLHEGHILDGIHRWIACRQLGIE
jgi:ParB-like chromosome segregation protein Spo0J